MLMRNRTSVPVAIFIMVTAALNIACPASADNFRAAIAIRDVTPKTLMPVSGGVGPSAPTNRVIGKLTVRALVLESGKTRVALCSVDFLGFPAALCDQVRANVPAIPAQNIIIAATHTHSAPDCYGFPNEKGETAIDADYVRSVCNALAEAINGAVENLAPATIKIATGNARGKIAYNYYAEQLYDPRCHVIQVLDPSGNAIATLVNYACHPEVIGSDQGIISPDFVGPLYDRIIARDGGTPIFINSAQGGMVTADCRGPDGKDIRTHDECIRIGRLLADESLRIIADAPIQNNPALFCATTTIKFPVDSPLMKSLIATSPTKVKLDPQGRIAAQLNLINLADAQILTIPGEAMPNIGYYLKRKMHGAHNLLLGLANDGLGYILTKEDFDSFKRYEYITRTSLGENTGEILITEALKLVDKSPRPAAATKTP